MFFVVSQLGTDSHLGGCYNLHRLTAMVAALPIAVEAVGSARRTYLVVLAAMASLVGVHVQHSNPQAN